MVNVRRWLAVVAVLLSVAIGSERLLTIACEFSCEAHAASTEHCTASTNHPARLAPPAFRIGVGLVCQHSFARFPPAGTDVAVASPYVGTPLAPPTTKSSSVRLVRSTVGHQGRTLLTLRI